MARKGETDRAAPLAVVLVGMIFGLFLGSLAIAGAAHAGEAMWASSSRAIW